MFNFFGSKKNTSSDNAFNNDLVILAAYNKISSLVQKANNLIKLGRTDEAHDVLSQAEEIALKTLRDNPRTFLANLLLAHFYKEAQIYDKAEYLYSSLLNSDQYDLDEEQRLSLKADLLKVRRGKVSSNGRYLGIDDKVTKLYSCQNCGRIISFLTLPCPHCQWHPTDLQSLARSMVLLDSSLNVQNLLLLARQVSQGKAPSEIVSNLGAEARKYLEDNNTASNLNRLFGMLQENLNNAPRDINMLRECPNCGERVILSEDDQCNSCSEDLNLPDSVRLIICLDNILWLLEQRVNLSTSKEFSDFVYLLAMLISDLLYKQETPSANKRSYAISLLRDVKSISDLNRGAIIDTTNPKLLNMYFVKENMNEDSEQYGLFLCSELKYFVEKMISGINLKNLNPHGQS